jgi:tetratricopeptide (TPR) repeat protein
MLKAGYALIVVMWWQIALLLLCVPAFADWSCKPKGVSAEIVCADLDGFDPLLVSSITTCGEIKRRNGEYEVAVSLFTEALKSSTEDAALFAKRGSGWGRLKKYTCAARDYDTAIRLEPGNPGYHFARGVSRFWIDEFDGAISDFSHSLRIEPDFKLPHLFRGLTFEQQDKLFSAREDLNQFLRDNPREAVARRALSRVERKIERRKGLGCAIDPTNCS